MLRATGAVKHAQLNISSLWQNDSTHQCCTLGACSDQPALAVEAKAAAATLLMQLGRLHMQQQARQGSAPAAPIQPEAALHCFKEAAARVQAFGQNTPFTHIEFAVPSCAG